MNYTERGLSEPQGHLCEEVSLPMSHLFIQQTFVRNIGEKETWRSDHISKHQFTYILGTGAAAR